MKRGWDSTWPILYNIGNRATYRAQGEGGVLTVRRFVNTKILPAPDTTDHAAR